MSGVCRMCRSVEEHRPGCEVQAVRYRLLATIAHWHAVAHEGPFDSCDARECYAGHHAVLPKMGEVISR